MICTHDVPGKLLARALRPECPHLVEETEGGQVVLVLTVCSAIGLYFAAAFIGIDRFGLWSFGVAFWPAVFLALSLPIGEFLFWVAHDAFLPWRLMVSVRHYNAAVKFVTLRVKCQYTTPVSEAEQKPLHDAIKHLWAWKKALESAGQIYREKCALRRLAAKVSRTSPNKHLKAIAAALATQRDEALERTLGEELAALEALERAFPTEAETEVRDEADK